MTDQISLSPAEKMADEIKCLALYPVAFVFPQEYISLPMPWQSMHAQTQTIYVIRQSDPDERGVSFRTAVVNCVVHWYHDHSQDGGMLYKAAGDWRLFCYGRHWGPVIDEEALIGQLGGSVTGQVERIIRNALHQEDMDRAFYQLANQVERGSR